jgi:histidinol dehydrogenase
VLPTFGSARYAGALSVDDFVRRMHVISSDRAGLARRAGHIATLAESEGLPAHVRSVTERVAAGS